MNLSCFHPLLLCKLLQLASRKTVEGPQSLVWCHNLRQTKPTRKTCWKYGFIYNLRIQTVSSALHTNLMFLTAAIFLLPSGAEAPVLLCHVRFFMTHQLYSEIRSQQRVKNFVS